MSDHQMLEPTGAALLLPRQRSLRSTSDSPMRQRYTDDLVSHLTAHTAVDALRNPSGVLKASMDAATPAARAFAMRAAVASKSILEWLEELSTWPWPEETSSAGFERPPAKRRKFIQGDENLDEVPSSTGDQTASNEGYVGSVLRTEIARYEQRVDSISQEMEDLAIEEIKMQVLHNHILPLSRPGTPISDSNSRLGSRLSMTSLARMDDFSALVTAIIIQALPNLSKLTHLMNTWNVRLLVLRKSASFHKALVDAQVALESGWKVMDLERGDKQILGGRSDSRTILSRSDFDVMKSVLERKVAQVGPVLDQMLDALEGRKDTLPDEWIDQVDTLECSYGDWVTACERKVRGAELARLSKHSEVDPGDNRPTLEGSNGTPRAVQSRSSDSKSDLRLHSQAVKTGDNGGRGPMDVQNFEAVGLCARNLEATVAPMSEKQPTSITASIEERTDYAIENRATAESSIKSDDISSAQVFRHTDSEPSSRSEHARSEQSPAATPHLSLENGVKMSAVLDSIAGNGAIRSSEAGPTDGVNEIESDLDLPPTLENSEPDLPRLPKGRTSPKAPEAPTIFNHPSNAPLDPNLTAVDASPVQDAGWQEVRVDGAASIDDTTPPSSPPEIRSHTPSASISFNGIPTYVERPDEDHNALPSSLVDVSDEEVESEAENDLSHTSPSLRGPTPATLSPSDAHLQQQISEILEALPAKITLTSEPNKAISLNPPDFKMPTMSRARPKVDPIARSASSLSTRSSRAGTPSFTLTPAYGRNTRVRAPRGGNQEIKLYHLSRSNGEAPIKLFIRCVGENGQRVMVRVGGGWADLGEYLKEYISHHGRRSTAGGNGKVEVTSSPRMASFGRGPGSSPPSRPPSALDHTNSPSPLTPLNVRKTRKTVLGDEEVPKTPLETKAPAAISLASSSNNTPATVSSTRSRSDSRLSWTEEDSSLGMAGPRARNVEMSEESRAWVESVKEKVRLASGERKTSSSSAATEENPKFGEMGRVGATKRLFRKLM